MAVKRKSKGKRHPAHSASFITIAKDLYAATLDPKVLLLHPNQILEVIAAAMMKEGKRVRRIVR